MLTEKSRFNRRHHKQGSALLTSMIMVMAVGFITAGFFTLAHSEYRAATRSFLLGASFSLAEAGVDRAIYSLNTDNLSAWTESDGGQAYTYTFPPDPSGLTQAVNVVILNASSSNPVVYSEGVISGHPAGDVKKLLRVGLSRDRGLGDSGLVAARIRNNGNSVEIKQYDSRLGQPGVLLADGTHNWSDELRVSTGSLEGGAIDVGNANIYGFIATGGGEPDFGPQGGVYSLENPDTHDPSRITYDYYENFQPIEAPEGFPDYVSPPTLSKGVNVLMDGVYALDGSGDSIRSTNGKDVLVAANTTVTLILSNGAELDLGGNLEIETGGQLLIYTDGDIGISGDINSHNTEYDSVADLAPAQRLSIYGTNPTDGAQTIKIHGAAQLAAYIYAPGANVELKGGGGSDVGYLNGAVVAYDVVINGNMQFRYDRALGDLENVSNEYYAVQWAELNNETPETAKIAIGDYFN